MNPLSNHNEVPPRLTFFAVRQTEAGKGGEAGSAPFTSFSSFTSPGSKKCRLPSQRPKIRSSTNMNEINFNDPKVRKEYFQPKPGMPSDSEIYDSVNEMVAFMAPHAMPDDPFITNDICLSIRWRYPNLGIYIGQRVSRLVKAGQLPIRRIGTRNKRALYSIVK